MEAKRSTQRRRERAEVSGGGTEGGPGGTDGGTKFAELRMSWHKQTTARTQQCAEAAISLARFKP